MNRRLLWDGCGNVRDLGGLPTRDGRTTLQAALVRSDHPNRLSAAGWAQLGAYGTRTIVTLMTDGVPVADQMVAVAPNDIDIVTVAIEDVADAEFSARWAETGLWGTPLYWADALARWPDRHVRAIRAIAHARPGGVLVHCGRGHDRTGIVVALVLSVLGVPPEAIAADYDLSAPSLPADEQATLRRVLEQHQTSSRAEVVAFLNDSDVEVHLRAGGLTDHDLDALRDRLVV